MSRQSLMSTLLGRDPDTRELFSHLQNEIDRLLIIEGSKKTASEKKATNYHLVERSSGSFVRRIPLGFDVDPEQVDASSRNGVLHLSIPNPPEAAAAT